MHNTICNLIVCWSESLGLMHTQRHKKTALLEVSGVFYWCPWTQLHDSIQPFKHVIVACMKDAWKNAPNSRLWTFYSYTHIELHKHTQHTNILASRLSLCACASKCYTHIIVRNYIPSQAFFSWIFLLAERFSVIRSILIWPCAWGLSSVGMSANLCTQINVFYLQYHLVDWNDIIIVIIITIE